MMTSHEYPLDKIKIAKRFVSAMLSWLLVDVILVAVLFFVPALPFSSSALPLGVALFLVLTVWQYVYETKYFDAYFYDAESNFLAIKKGWITPREIQLPYEKMQDVYMDQDIFDRLFGLWDVHVSTATAMSGMEAHMDGLKRGNAEAIRKRVLEKINSKRKNVTGYD